MTDHLDIVLGRKSRMFVGLNLAVSTTGCYITAKLEIDFTEKTTRAQKLARIDKSDQRLRSRYRYRQMT